MPKRTSTNDSAGPAQQVLNQRTLNRTLLRRQMLLQRATMPVPELIEHLVGLQAQVPNNPYVGLWSRLVDFDPTQLSYLIQDRHAVRMALLRATLHLITARDALVLRPVLHETLKRGLMKGSPFGRRLEGMDLDALVATGRALVEAKPLTYAELRAQLTPLWPERDSASLTYGVHYLAPLVQVPPRGLWQQGGQPVTTTLEAWLGRSMSEETAPDSTILRYLAAFGPGGPADAQSWSGMQGMREIFDRLRPQLRAFRDENSRELFDLPDAPIVDADQPSPVRFMPEYDNVLLGHADRTRIVSEANRKRTSRLNGYAAAILIDGFVGGSWKIARQRKIAIMQVELFDAVTPAQRVELESEAGSLLEFMTPGATAREVEILPAD